ncbi:MAG TPA: hypothetical protein VFZ66_04455 [Herpetosiphonaceae bacterium]
MLKTERTATHSVAAKRPERLAWAILLCSFALFCFISTSSGLYIYRWWSQPTIGVLTASVVQPLAVQVQPAGLVQPVVLQDGRLNQGDRVIVRQEATPGLATTLRFDSATIGLWAGTTLQIGRFGQEWNDPAHARFRLESGQMMVDLTGDDVQLQIETSVSRTPVVLQSPGRYRIRILNESTPTVATAERPEQPLLEVATERGAAAVGKTVIDRGFRLLQTVDGQQDLKLTSWDLLRDGSFQQLVDSVFGSSPTDPLPWIYTVKPTAEGAADSGLVIPAQDCANSLERKDCQLPYVRLVRRGGNDKGFLTAIAQQVDADVASYQHLRLKADVKIVHQSLSKAGQTGTECPLLIRVVYTNHIAANLHKDFCFWAFEYQNQNGVVSNEPQIETTQLAPNTWRSLDIDLKQELERLVEVQEISFQANGHDYESQVRGARLVGEGLADLNAPENAPK